MSAFVAAHIADGIDAAGGSGGGMYRAPAARAWFQYDDLGRYGRRCRAGDRRCRRHAGTHGQANAGARQCEGRSEEHTSELQSLMRISYAVFCLKKKTQRIKTTNISTK